MQIEFNRGYTMYRSKCKEFRALLHSTTDGPFRDLSDLYDTLTFFRGEDEWTNPNDALAASIAKAGKEWSRTYYRREDMTAYMFR